MVWLRPLLAACEMNLRLRVVSPLAWFGVLLQPAIFAGIGLVLLGGGDRPHVAYAVLGGGLVGLWGATLVNASFDLQSERWSGTLELLLGAPVPLLVVMSGKVLASILPGLASFLVTMAMAFVALGTWPPVDALPLAVSFVLNLLAFYSLGLILAPLFGLIRPAGGLINCLEVPLFLLCGFMFPVTQLPGWLAPLSWALAPYWAIRGMYGATGEGAQPHYAAWWLLAVLLVVADVAIAWRIVRAVERRCRVTGELASV